MFWFVFSTLVLLFAYLGDENNLIYRGNIKLFRGLLIITLSYAVGFGGQPFQDHYGYVLYYNDIANVDFSLNLFYNIYERTESLEFFYFVLNKICNFIGLGIPGFFFIVALIVNTLMVNVFYKFKNPTFTLLIFIISAYFFQQMNIVRQMIAVSIFIFSIQYLIDKKPIPFIILILTAFFFHTSALFLIVFSIFSFINIEDKKEFVKKSLLILWIFSFIISIGLVSFDILKYLPFLPVYENYYILEDSVGMKLTFNIVYNFSILLFYLLFSKNNIHIIYTFFFILGGILINLSITIPNLSRFSYYFSVVYCFYLPSMLSDRCINKNIRLILNLIFILYYITSLYTNFIFNDSVLLGSKMYRLSDFFL